ncbi:cytochrome P450 [Sulfitobacter sp. S0837]|uniref:cytochrome P450 n=1 Tax=Sulfitobacter maritimus TaxID=2741719 RepID=UPI0015826854|nr:cytochrome P450 [Sulfitobacter maritimus]NUH63993.1 cytochrome P450 [Sulfitobacter maritimus]
MSDIPSARGFDSTLALFRNPYGFISKTCRDLDADLFETRILLQKTICITGAAAAEVFYRENRLIRTNSMPGRIQKTLLGKGGVQGLDGATHQHRKKMFMSLMGTERIAALEGMSVHMLDSFAPGWEVRDEIVLYDEVRELLTRVVCTWAGVPLPETEVSTRTAQLTALFQQAGAVGPKHWAARRARHRLEKWAAGMIQQVRDGKLQPTQESALHVIATWRDLNGELLNSKVAAVELLNILRPTVAVSVFVVQTAHALYRYSQWQEKLRDDEGLLEPFVQEVRRLYPFFPAVAARVRSAFEWRGYHFPEGRRVLLDLYGTNTDPRSWDAPLEFLPERFQSWDENPYNFIPQGGGDHYTNHRCPGEWIAISQMKVFCRYLVNEINYDVPDQGSELASGELPSLPKNRFIMRNIRRRQ